MTNNRSHKAWIQEEKGEHPGYYTVQEFAKRLGVSTVTVERKIKLGKIPQATTRTTNGWRLWSPEVVREALDNKLRGRL